MVSYQPRIGHPDLCDTAYMMASRSTFTYALYLILLRSAHYRKQGLGYATAKYSLQILAI